MALTFIVCNGSVLHNVSTGKKAELLCHMARRITGVDLLSPMSAMPLDLSHEHNLSSRILRNICECWIDAEAFRNLDCDFCQLLDTGSPAHPNT